MWNFSFFAKTGFSRPSVAGPAARQLIVVTWSFQERGTTKSFHSLGHVVPRYLEQRVIPSGPAWNPNHDWVRLLERWMIVIPVLIPWGAGNSIWCSWPREAWIWRRDLVECHYILDFPITSGHTWHRGNPASDQSDRISLRSRFKGHFE